MATKPKDKNKPSADAVNHSANLSGKEAAAYVRPLTEKETADNVRAILTKKEAANYVHCTVRYLERQVRAGRLRALKPTGKLVRFFRRDLDAFLLSGASIA
jgi:excisionase family DNA binding protein